MASLDEEKDAIVAYVVHVFFGSVLFALTILPALGIHLFVEWLNGKHAGRALQSVTSGAEYFLLAVDVVLFMVFVSRTAWKMLRRIA